MNYPIEFKGMQDDWDLIWDTIRTDMESPAFSPELREQLKGAYERIMDANYPDRTAPLQEEDIVIGKTYRIRTIDGVKGVLRGKLVKVEAKSDTHGYFRSQLLLPARGFRVGQILHLDNWMLEEE